MPRSRSAKVRSRRRAIGCFTKGNGVRLLNRFRVIRDFGTAISPILRSLAQRGMMEERRATPRQRVFKDGTIEFGGTGVDCTIRNISPVGAAIDVASPVDIPHEVTLKILRHN